MKKTPSAERLIEDAIIRSTASLGYAEALVFRNCRAGRRMRIADVVILPRNGPHRMVLVKAKEEVSPDAASKVVGRLLVYCGPPVTQPSVHASSITSAGVVRSQAIGAERPSDRAGERRCVGRLNQPRMLRWGTRRQAMAKKAARTRSVQTPKAKSSVSLQKIEKAIRTVALNSPSSAKQAGKRSERAAAGHR